MAHAASCGKVDQGHADVTAATQTSLSSQVGTNNTMRVTVVNVDGSPVSGYCVDFIQNFGPSTGWPRSAFSDPDGYAAVTWTSSTAPSTNPTDSITASATDANGQTGKTQTIRHTWTAKPTPSPTPSPTKSPSPKPSPKPSPASPTPSPTAKPTTASPTPSPTTSATATPTASASPSASPVPVPTSSDFGAGSLELDRPSALPGGSATLRGRNCPPGSAVTYTVEGTSAGTSTAGTDGTFTGTVQLPDASLGQHLIQVTCAGQTAAVPIDFVVSSSSTSSPAAGATTAAVLVFFVLLGSVLFARHQGTTIQPAIEEQLTEDES